MNAVCWCHMQGAINGCPDWLAGMTNSSISWCHVVAARSCHITNLQRADKECAKSQYIIGNHGRLSDPYVVPYVAPDQKSLYLSLWPRQPSARGLKVFCLRGGDPFSMGTNLASRGSTENNKTTNRKSKNVNRKVCFFPILIYIPIYTRIDHESIFSVLRTAIMLT